MQLNWMYYFFLEVAKEKSIKVRLLEIHYNNTEGTATPTLQRHNLLGGVDDGHGDVTRKGRRQWR
jgi:hypothetical protein